MRSRDELGAYLLEHARRERLAMLSRPVIEFATDNRLRLGEFGIQTRVVAPQQDEPDPSAPPVPVADAGHTIVYGADESDVVSRRRAARAESDAPTGRCC